MHSVDQDPQPNPSRSGGRQGTCLHSCVPAHQRETGFDLISSQYVDLSDFSPTTVAWKYVDLSFSRLVKHLLPPNNNSRWTLWASSAFTTTIDEYIVKKITWKTTSPDMALGGVHTTVMLSLSSAELWVIALAVPWHEDFRKCSRIAVQ